MSANFYQSTPSVIPEPSSLRLTGVAGAIAFSSLRGWKRRPGR